MTEFVLQKTHAWIDEAARRTHVPAAERGDFVLYTRSSLDEAQAIVPPENFRDAVGETSIQLSDKPPDITHGPEGRVLLCLHFRGDLDQLAQYERVEEAEVRRKDVLSSLVRQAAQLEREHPGFVVELALKLTDAAVLLGSTAPEPKRYREWRVPAEQLTNVRVQVIDTGDY